MHPLRDRLHLRVGLRAQPELRQGPHPNRVVRSHPDRLEYRRGRPDLDRSARRRNLVHVTPPVSEEHPQSVSAGPDRRVHRLDRPTPGYPDGQDSIHRLPQVPSPLQRMVYGVRLRCRTGTATCAPGTLGGVRRLLWRPPDDDPTAASDERPRHRARSRTGLSARGRQGRAAGRHAGGRAGQADRGRRLRRRTAAVRRGRGRGARLPDEPRPAPDRQRRRARAEPPAGGEPAAGGVAGQALHGRGLSFLDLDPGGQSRPDPGGREVRLRPGLQVLHLRDVVDPPSLSVAHWRTSHGRSAFPCTSAS